jgi:hypothetical protein
VLETMQTVFAALAWLTILRAAFPRAAPPFRAVLASYAAAVALNAAAYSVAQQLIVSAWDVVFAVGLVTWVFGWSGGKQLIRQSYADAEVKRRELREQREARRAAGGGRWRISR